MANINLLNYLRHATENHADGIGLYRSEFPFIARNDFPSEEEQFAIYQRLLEGFPGREVTIRTLDIGGDKVLSYFDDHLHESNPSLGMRSIRFSLKHRAIFEQQIRAILRGAAEREIRIMFPMVSSLDEFLPAKEVVTGCLSQLRKEKRAHQRRPQVGMMIELPSVLDLIDEIASEVDFFSIGTNDFVQYMLAVDRTNEKVADLYLPYHPSVLRALYRVVAAARKAEKDLSICGDMVHEIEYLTLLLGMGVRKVGVNPGYLRRTMAAIASIDLREAEQTASEVLAMSRVGDIEAALRRISGRRTSHPQKAAEPDR